VWVLFYCIPYKRYKDFNCFITHQQNICENKFSQVNFFVYICIGIYSHTMKKYQKSQRQENKKIIQQEYSSVLVDKEFDLQEIEDYINEQESWNWYEELMMMEELRIEEENLMMIRDERDFCFDQNFYRHDDYFFNEDYF